MWGETPQLKSYVKRTTAIPTVVNLFLISAVYIPLVEISTLKYTFGSFTFTLQNFLRPSEGGNSSFPLSIKI